MRWTQKDLDEFHGRREAWKDVDAEDTPDQGLESNLQQKVLAYCRANGWPCFHDRSRKKNNPGWPDNFVFLPGGVVVLVELKSEGGCLRSEQKSLRLALRWLKHEVHVVRSFRKFVEIIQRELKGEQDEDEKKGRINSP
ncbi:MAG: hypothetical protein JRC68_10145 [Deltaproteobacteria bacterium]|nr:hypothetical protein [Deltaproteobacteria bacterium]